MNILTCTEENTVYRCPWMPFGSPGDPWCWGAEGTEGQPFFRLAHNRTAKVQRLVLIRKEDVCVQSFCNDLCYAFIGIQ